MISFLVNISFYIQRRDMALRLKMISHSLILLAKQGRFWEAFKCGLIFSSRQRWWRWLTFERDQQQMMAPKNCWKPLESWNSLARYCSLNKIKQCQDPNYF
jgi:hypothetical protein